MKRCVIIGNCQAQALCQILKEGTCFLQHYTIDRLIIIHHIASDEMRIFLERDLPELDLVIHQPVSEGYRGVDVFSTRTLLSHLGPRTRSILIPNSYFNGYFPELIYLKDPLGEHISKYDIFYHDRNIFLRFIRRFRPLLEQLVQEFNQNGQDWVEGETLRRIPPEDLSSFVKETVEELKREDFYSKDQSLYLAAVSINELELREREPFGSDKPCDISVAKFIRENFRQRRLFNTINHPTVELLNYVAEKILWTLGLYPSVVFERDLLAPPIFPIYPSTQRHLELEFACPDVWVLLHSTQTREQVVEFYTRYYALALKASTLLINAERLGEH